MTERKKIVIIAGPNGAGKTTFARQLLPALYPGVPFLKVDEVQTEDGAFAHPVAGTTCTRRSFSRSWASASGLLAHTPKASGICAR